MNGIVLTFCRTNRSTLCFVILCIELRCMFQLDEKKCNDTIFDKNPVGTKVTPKSDHI